MSDPGKTAQSEIRIDRLVLDIPGLDPAKTKSLATEVAERLSKTGVSGKQDKVQVTLDGTTPDLAARIVAAIRERLV